MSIEKDISKLFDAKVIDESTAQKIAEFYKSDSTNSSNRILVVFGVIGSILVGLGIILILAHNWDSLYTLTKNVIAFTPLVLSQILCGIVLFKPIDKPAWRESAATLLFFGVGSSIALISQVYHLPSDLSAYLLIWMSLSLPIVYVLESRAVSMLFIIGITSYGMNVGYFTNTHDVPYLYWFLLGGIIPFYFYISKDHKKDNFTKAHHWFIALSVLICFNTIFAKSDSDYVLLLITSFSMLGIFYSIGHRSYFQDQGLRSNPYKVLGSLGTIIMLMVLSFDFYWDHLFENGIGDLAMVSIFDIAIAILVSLICLVLVVLNFRSRENKSPKPIEFVFLIFIILFFIGLYSPLAYYLTNVLLLGIAVLTILEGTNQNHLGILNYGLLIIAVLITCRFFDSNLSFFIRGILFVLIGIGFFLGNYWFLNKRKQDVE